MKKQLFGFFVLALLLMSSSVLLAQGVQDITISMGSAYSDGIILNDVCVKFKEVIETNSDGKIKVDLFLGGSLGSDEDVMMAVTSGVIDGQAVGGVLFNSYAPNFAFIDSPFVIKDWDHLVNILDSELGNKFKNSVENNGNHTVAAPIYRGKRNFTSNKAINGPEDLKGLKLRLPVLEVWVTLFGELGCKIVPIPLGELYTSLATGVAEASEGDLAQISGYDLQEVQSHLSLTGHSVGIGFLTFNSNWLKNLNEATRNMVLDAAAEAADWATEKMFKGEEDLINELAEAGMEVVYPDRDALFEAGMPIMEDIFEEYFEGISLEDVQSLAN